MIYASHIIGLPGEIVDSAILISVFTTPAHILIAGVHRVPIKLIRALCLRHKLWLSNACAK